tara:strand:+ start:15632 stop:15976 length:345 start_codon:yes stop_codon:yes gene_type:complete
MPNGSGLSKLVYFAKEKKMAELDNKVLPEGGEQPEAPQLSLQDIATFVQIIDIVSRRGGFEGQELEAIGGLRNRVVAFLNAASESQGKDAPEGLVPEAPAGDDLPDEVEAEEVN